MVTYYFSTSIGDDSRTSAQAQSQSTPWKTITKLNSIFSTLLPGDVVSFKAGEVFPGSIAVNKSGTSGNPITFNAWGTGAKPKISGFTSLTSWTSIGTNLWQTTAAISTLSSLKMVVINGAHAKIGKFPTVGYNTISSITSTTVTSQQALSASYLGGTVVIRKEHWVVDNALITNQSGNILTFSNTINPTNYLGRSGFGYFVQNHQAVCDTQNEWWYDTTTKKLGMFSTSSPTGVQASTVDVLMTIGTNSYLTFNGLEFEGSNSAVATMSSAHHIIFTGCNVSFNGTDMLTCQVAVNNNTLTNCTISWTNNNVITGGTSPTWTITNNTITDTGTVAGMGYNDSSTYSAFANIGPNSLIQYNTIRRCGYIGIDFRGSGIQVLNNLVDTFASVKDDGGGIYTYTGPGTVTQSAQRTVDGNIVINGIGAPAGTNTTNGDAFGIYMDDNSSQVTISNNTIANCGGAGLYLHASHALSITNNKIYNCVTTGGYGQILEVYPGATATDPVRNITFSGNQLISKTTSQIVAYLKTDEANMTQWGTWNNNYYCRPMAENSSTFTIITSGGTTVGNLTNWKTASGMESTSHTTPAAAIITDVNKLRFDYNATTSPVVVSLPGTYIDMTGVSHVGSITLPAFGSSVLVQTSASTSSTTTAAPTSSTTTTTHAPTTTTTTTLGSTTTTTSHSTTTTTTATPTTTTTSSTTTTTTLFLTPLNFTVVSGNLAENINITGSWGTGYGYGLAMQFIAANGFIQADYAGVANQTAILGFDTTNTLEDYALLDYALYVQPSDSQYQTIANGTFAGTGIIAQVGDKYRLNRVGSSIRAEYSRNNGQTWTVIKTFTVTTSASLYAKASIPTTGKTLLNPKGFNMSNVPTTTTTTTSSSTTTTTTHAPTTTTTTTAAPTTTTSTTTTTTGAPTTTTTSTSTTSTTTAATTTTTSTSTSSTSTTSSSSTTTTTTLALTDVIYPTVSGVFAESPGGRWGSGYGYGLSTQYLAGNGFIQANYTTTTNTTALIGLDVSFALTDYTGFDYCLYIRDTDKIYLTAANNIFTSSGVVALVGDLYRLIRTSAVVKAEYSRDNGQTWITLRTFPVTTSANLYAKASIPTTLRYLLNPKGFGLSTLVTTTTSSSTTTTTTQASTTTSTTNISTLSPLKITLVKKTNVSCRGGSNGLITVSASGGSGGYLYQLNTGSFQSSPNFTGLIAGRYTVTVKDSGNRTASLNVTVYNGFFPC